MELAREERPSLFGAYAYCAYLICRVIDNASRVREVGASAKTSRDTILQQLVLGRAMTALWPSLCCAASSLLHVDVKQPSMSSDQRCRN